MGNLWILYSKSKDNWGQSFHHIPYMVILFPYKEMAETWNWNISKTTHRIYIYNIFRDDVSIQYLSFYTTKKIGGKKMDPKFSITWLRALRLKIT